MGSADHKIRSLQDEKDFATAKDAAKCPEKTKTSGQEETKAKTSKYVAGAVGGGVGAAVVTVVSEM